MSKYLEQLTKEELLKVIQTIASGDPTRLEFSHIHHDALGAIVNVTFDKDFVLHIGWPEQFVSALIYCDSSTARRDLLNWLCELLFEGAYMADWVERAEKNEGRHAGYSLEELEELTCWDVIDTEVQQLLFELLCGEQDAAEWLTDGMEWKRRLAEKFSNLCL